MVRCERPSRNIDFGVASLTVLVRLRWCEFVSNALVETFECKRAGFPVTCKFAKAAFAKAFESFQISENDLQDKFIFNYLEDKTRQDKFTREITQ